MNHEIINVVTLETLQGALQTSHHLFARKDAAFVLITITPVAQPADSANQEKQIWVAGTIEICRDTKLCGDLTIQPIPIERPTQV